MVALPLQTLLAPLEESLELRYEDILRRVPGDARGDGLIPTDSENLVVVVADAGDRFRGGGVSARTAEAARQREEPLHLGGLDRQAFTGRGCEKQYPGPTEEVNPQTPALVGDHAVRPWMRTLIGR